MGVRMNCNKCNVEMVPVFLDRNRRHTDLPMYENALVIRISGGYGMFIDDFVAPFVICDNCAKELFDQNQWLVTPEISYLSKEVINEQ